MDDDKRHRRSSKKGHERTTDRKIRDSHKSHKSEKSSKSHKHRKSTKDKKDKKKDKSKKQRKTVQEEDSFYTDVDFEKKGSRHSR